jgi:hypothetical protein
VVYFVLALLYSDWYEEVMRKLVQAVRLPADVHRRLRAGRRRRPADGEHFGYRSGKNGTGAFPRVECGTHAITAAEAGVLSAVACLSSQRTLRTARH